ncbi:hypothetical protein GFL03_21310 [Pseudomonas stutzeri]|uniref:hypothetical protein n=1 Tax=Stutzerimonas frequens TaxID=2968969 RepID=UPI00190D4572|nr:hypothetical protein [Stutzerimonas frequens]MBK3919813.1 hypothetical protein [Stutzerimonas frequens]
MYKEQRDRLVAERALGLSKEQASAIVARCYGYTALNDQNDSLSAPIDGLQKIKAPDEIRALDDRVLQMMEFVRMSQNLVAPKLPAVTNGIRQGTLIATMWGFPNFEALKAYAREDTIDPVSTDPAEMARFKRRTRFIPPSQYLLGRDYSGNTLIIHTNEAETSQWIDQELCLNELSDLQVAAVRCRPDGDDYINRYSNDHTVLRQDLSEEHSSYLLGARKESGTRLAISIVPKRIYTLEELVASHYAALSEKSPRGRSLIIDRIPLATDEGSLDAGWQLARDIGLNVVIVTSSPSPEIWTQCRSRLIFGFDRSLPLSDNSEMNSAVIFATPFVGLKRNNLQLVYHSAESGAVYGTVQLIPDERPKGAQIIKRIFGARRMG